MVLDGLPRVRSESKGRTPGQWPAESRRRGSSGRGQGTRRWQLRERGGSIRPACEASLQGCCCSLAPEDADRNGVPAGERPAQAEKGFCLRAWESAFGSMFLFKVFLCA